MFEDLLKEIEATQEERRSTTEPEEAPDLTIEENRERALAAVEARRFKATLTSGRVLLHSRPGGLTRGEAIELSKDWGEVAECVPIAYEEGPGSKDVMATPVPLDLTLAAATTGLPITAGQFRFFLSQDDLTDIAAGLIPVECLRAYAELFSKRLALGSARQ